MKHFLSILIALVIIGCKKENETKKQEVTDEVTSVKETKGSAKFNLAKAENSVGFTAYKTTKKVGVKGLFEEFEITANGTGETIKEAINGAEFKIPVNSIETKDSGRNFKIIKFFFGTMKETLALTGKVSLTDETNGIVDFTMNGITEKLLFTYTITDNVFSMKTAMDVNSWKGQEAISKLNEACKDLHKGDDGVSKTWNTVDVEVTSTFK